jgi:hypothetical protein
MFLLDRELEKNLTLQHHPMAITIRKTEGRGSDFGEFACRLFGDSIKELVTGILTFIESPKNWSFKTVANLCLLYSFRNIICEKLKFPTEK